MIVVDYKATSSATKGPSLDDDWKIQYKRQADVSQWLARRQGLKVSDTAYFVYANGLHLGGGRVYALFDERPAIRWQRCLG